MGERRRVRLFRSGGHQVVRIPVAFELPGEEAIMHREGARLVIETVRKRGLVALLAAMTPIEEAFPEIGDEVPGAERTGGRREDGPPSEARSFPAARGVEAAQGGGKPRRHWSHLWCALLQH